MGCGSPPPEAAPPAPTEVGVEPAAAPLAVAAAEGLDREIAGTEALIAKHDNDWTRREELAGLFQRRARLTGRFADWIRADETLVAAFAIAPEGSGPHLSAARLEFALHRLDGVEPHLAAHERRILVDEPDRAEIARIRGDVALQRGDHATARTHYDASLALRPSLPATYGHVQLAWWEARFDDAYALLDTCDTLVHGKDENTRAWLDLQRGLIALDRGRWEEAERHYLAADLHFPGWYLVIEHLAEVRAEMGRIAEAEAAWRAVIDSTGGAPEFLDALAESRRNAGDIQSADALAARAEAGWRDLLSRYPTAASGHAFDHFLARDPAFALELARKDVAVRPNGSVRTRLAAALLANGDAPGARAEVEAVLATPYRSAALYAVGAEAGGPQAADWRSAALAIDPHSVDAPDNPPPPGGPP